MVIYRYQKWMIVLFVLYMFLIHYQWPTLSGQGLELTINMIVWLVVGLLALALTSGLYRRRWRFGLAPSLVLLGGGLLTLPIFWSSTSAVHVLTIQRLAGLWSVICIYLLLVQWPASQTVKVALATLIALSATIESILAVLQVIFADWSRIWLNYSFLAAEGRPLGSLLQVNLLGSFLCTGLACSLWLFLFKPPLNNNSRRYWLLVIILTCGVVVTQSRTAWTGMFLSIAVIVFCAISQRGWQTTSVSILGIIIGIVLGICVLTVRTDRFEVVSGQLPPHSSAAIPQETQARLDYNRLHSGLERQTMITGTLAMIASHPWKGSGLGHFERDFPEVLSKRGWSNPFTRTVIYPHNEMLYVWAEGGIVAVLGFIVLGILWLLPVLGRTRRKSISFWAISIPIVLHMMTEYPFYQSALHLLTLVLLMALSVPRCWLSGKTMTFKYQRIGIFGCYFAACIGGVFMVTGLISAMQLRKIELLGLQVVPEEISQINPWVQPDHFLFDRAVSRLMNFNKTQDTQQLKMFREEAEIYLRHHNDANLIGSLLVIAHTEGRLADVQIWNERGCLSFPQDPRFSCR